jgi:hypothetical protein
MDVTNHTTKTTITAKRKIKDSVFTDLFSIPKYTLQLYQSLHGNDEVTTELDIEIITIENVLLNQLYNDLGFRVGDKLFVFVEAQSTWSENIVVRVLLYVAETLQRYFVNTEQNLYGEKKVYFPKPELYVLFTGERKEHPKLLTLSDSFFQGEEADINLKVHMLYDGQQGDILSQYVAFTKICNEQCKKYGRTHEAVLETIRICEEQNILKEYLQNRKEEVLTMMMTLFDEEYNLKMYEKDIFNQGMSQGMSQGISQGMSQGISQGINQGLVATINMCREQFGKTVDETIQAIKEAYHLSQSEAESIVKENWK